MTDDTLANIAQDIEINQFIEPYMLPPGPQLPECYPELGLELKKGCHYYYDKLVQAKKNKNCPNLNDLLECVNGGGGQSTVPMTIPGKGVVDVTIPNHSSWGEFDNLSEAEQKLVRTQTEHILTEIVDQIVKSRGTVPGEFTELIKRLNKAEPPKFDWRGYLRRFTGGSQEVFTRKSRRKFNKRYEENPGMKLKPKRHILVAIDTSGSVSTNELKEFMGEIHHIHKSGSEVTVCQCDTAISSIEKYNHRSGEIKIHGRGGTSFEPVIEYYNANTHRFTCLVYFTDGEAPAPPRAHGKMLWVLSSRSSRNESLLGPQIKLN